MATEALAVSPRWTSRMQSAFPLAFALEVAASGFVLIAFLRGHLWSLALLQMWRALLVAGVALVLRKASLRKHSAEPDRLGFSFGALSVLILGLVDFGVLLQYEGALTHLCRR